MTHDDAFLREIIERPDEDVSRLVYADRNVSMREGDTARQVSGRNGSRKMCLRGRFPPEPKSFLRPIL